jgi:inositol phosphorylceramide mannosyltransferase catalytic subunit
MEGDDSQKQGLLAPSRTSSETAYEDERLDWESPAPRRGHWSERRWLRCLPRLSKVALILAVIDFVIVSSLVAIFFPLITLLVRNEELFGARLSLPLETPSNTHQDTSKQTIPRIFHQTTKNETIREEWRDAHQSCQEAYSDFEYMVRATRHCVTP